MHKLMDLPRQMPTLRTPCWPLLMLLLIASAPGAAAARSSRCPGVDYGSGMVASVLSDTAAQALRDAHAAVLFEARDLRSDYLRDAIYAPHISIIYDITESRTTPAQKALHAYLHPAHTSTLSFGPLVYWDDAKGGKTSLVVAIEDPGQTLSQLHAAIAQAALRITPT